MCRLGHHIGPWPAQDNCGLGKLLRRGGTAACVEVDGVWCGGFKDGFFLLREGEHIQNRFTHDDSPYCPCGTLWGVSWTYCTTLKPASQ